MKELNRITEAIIGSAIEIHRVLGPGLLEATYEAADILAATINGLPEETLRNAIDLVREQLGESLGDDDEEEK